MLCVSFFVICRICLCVCDVVCCDRKVKSNARQREEKRQKKKRVSDNANE